VGKRREAKKLPAKPTPKWQILENVVATWEQIRQRMPGAITVTQRAQVSTTWDDTVRRDIDVLVEARVGERRIRIGIEVKDHGRPLDVGDLGQIVDLANDVHLDHYCVVSASGYTKDAEKKARHEGIELMTIQESVASNFWASRSGAIAFKRGPEGVGIFAGAR
jgi:Restriction endonuclease